MTWTCPKCERELKKENQWHNCVKTSVDNLLEGKPDELVLVSDKILSILYDWPGVTISTTQNCIVFVHLQTFLIIRPMKKELDLKFYSEIKEESPMVIKSILYSGRYENHVRLSNSTQLTTQVFALIRQSYQLL